MTAKLSIDGLNGEEGLNGDAPRNGDGENSLNGNRKLECRAVSYFRFHPDFSAAAFHDLLTKRQSDAGSGDFFSMEPFENPEDPRRVLRIDAHSIVAH